MINDFHPRPLRERILPSGTVKTHDPSRTLVRNSNNPRFDESHQEGRGGSRRSPLQQVTALINPLFSNDPGIRSFHHHHHPFLPQPVLEGCNLYSKVSLLGSFQPRCRGGETAGARDTESGLVYTIFERGGGGRLEISLQDRTPRSAEPDLLSAFLKRMERFGYRENQFRPFVGHPPSLPVENFPSRKFEYLITNRNLGYSKIMDGENFWTME